MKNAYIRLGAVILLTAGWFHIANAQVLHRVGLQGGGAIGLPDGWRVDYDQGGMLDASGPGGRVSLGTWLNVYTPVRGGFIRPPCEAPYDPAQALVSVLVNCARFAAPGAVRIEERTRDRYWNQGPGEMILYTNSTRQETCLSSILLAPTGPGQFMFYASGACGPAGSGFSRSLLTLLRVWSSWKIGDGVFQERFKQTALALNSVSNAVSAAAQRQHQAGVDNAQIWDKIIKGCAFPDYRPDSPYCEVPPPAR